MDLNSEYKPLKNFFSQYTLLDSLHFIWAISKNLQFDKEVPLDIEMSKYFNSITDANSKRVAYVTEWELEFWLKEAIKYNQIRGRKTLKSAAHFSELQKRSRILRDKIDSMRDYSGGIIHVEFFRMAHQQFLWQNSADAYSIYRAYKIYSQPQVLEFFTKFYGLTALEYFVCGLSLSGMFNNKFACSFPSTSSIPMITNEMLCHFIRKHSISIEDMRALLKEQEVIDEDIFYKGNPFWEYPILFYERDKMCCPMTTLLIWKCTNGIFYDLIKAFGSEFGKCFGASFELYILGVIRHVNEKFKIIPEIVYNKGQNRSSDLIAESRDSYLFVECKAKRMQLKSKINIDYEAGVKEDLETVIGYLIKVYKTICDFINGKYEKLIFDKSKRIYVLLIALEDWYIEMNIGLQERLREELKKKLVEKGMSENLLKEIPYYLTSARAFETDFQKMHHFGFVEYFKHVDDSSITEKSKAVKIVDYIGEDFKKEIVNKVLEARS